MSANDEPLRALVAKLRNEFPMTTVAGKERNRCADELEALLPRSVQAQLLTDEERAAVALAANTLANGSYPDACAPHIAALTALLARAARGQDGEQQP